MNKVIIINLNGNAYQLEEDGYDALRAYLDAARSRLASNPDRDEIIADIEQAIADKFRALLGANKTVVLGREVQAVIKEMGPIDDGSGSPEPQPGAAAGPTPAGATTANPRRLYKIKDGAMVFGVCNGLAAYVNLDVTLVRLAFVLLTVFWGFGALVYIVMAILLPSATTPEDRAAAFGPPPTAADFVRRAKAGYYEGMRTFGDREAHREWRRRFREDMRSMKREFRQNARAWRYNWRFNVVTPPVAMDTGAWILSPVFKLMSLALTFLFLAAVITLLAKGTLLGLALPAGMPVWLAIILLFVLYNLIKWPIRMIRFSLRFGHPHDGIAGIYTGLTNAAVGLIGIFLVLWLVFHHPHQIMDALQNIGPEIGKAVHAFKQWWDSQ
jgi:phage shock protein PspC (stress-responsive transcriptional regulator)